MINKWESKNFSFFDFYINVLMSMLVLTNSTKKFSFDSFWDLEIVCTMSMRVCKTLHCCFVKFNFCQLDIIKILRMFSSNTMLETKVLIVLLIVVLRIFFETNNDMTNELIIDELLKTFDKQTWKQFAMILFDNELSSKNDDLIDDKTKFWYVYDCQYFCVISKNRS